MINNIEFSLKRYNGGDKMVFRKKKVDKKDWEDKVLKWVNTKIEEGTDMAAIKIVLTKKYGERVTNDFIKKNYGKDELVDSLDEEKKKDEAFSKLDNDIEALREEAADGEVTIEEPDDVPPEEPKTEVKAPPKQEKVKVEELFMYDIERLNLLAGIHNLLAAILEELKKGR